jgi:hypothetical protein
VEDPVHALLPEVRCLRKPRVQEARPRVRGVHQRLLLTFRRAPVHSERIHLQPSSLTWPHQPQFSQRDLYLSKAVSQGGFATIFSMFAGWPASSFRQHHMLSVTLYGR